jgi:membrane-associated phospholipid phosphatase
MILRSLGLGFLVLCSAPLASAEDQQSILRKTGEAIAQEVLRYGRDARGIATAPTHWDADRWEKAGLTALALAAVLTSDEEVRELVQRNRSDLSQDVADFITPFGGQRAQNISIGLMLVGLAVRNPNLRDTGRDALEATLFAGRILTPQLKRAIGRSRPFVDEGTYAFDPFSGHASFPSGHAANAFALASVVAAHYQQPWVRYSAYGLASAVAWARVHDDLHFASDVVAGAVVGTAMGRAVVARNRRPGEPPTVSWSPVLLDDGFAVQLTISIDQIRRPFPRRGP